SEINYQVTKLGNYSVRLTVLEFFDEETYTSHVDLTDNLNTTHRKYTQATTSFEVDNMAPVVSLDAMEQKEVEIIFNVGDVAGNGKYSTAEVQSIVNSTLLPKLTANNINANISVQERTYYEDAHIQMGYAGGYNSSTKRVYQIDYSIPKVIPTGIYQNEWLSGNTAAVAPNGDVYFIEEDVWNMHWCDDGQCYPTFSGFPISYYDVSENKIYENIVSPDMFKQITGIYAAYRYGSMDLYNPRNPRSAYIISARTDIAVTEKGNIVVAYTIDNNTTNGWHNRTSNIEVYFAKFSPTGELLDWGKFKYEDDDFSGSISFATEEYIGFYEYDGFLRGLDRAVMIYDAETVFDNTYSDVSYTNNYSDSTAKYYDYLGEDDSIYDTLLTEDKLVLLVRRNGWDGFLEYLTIDRNTNQVKKSRILGYEENIRMGDNTYYDTRYSEPYLLRDGRVVVSVSYNFNWKGPVKNSQLVIDMSSGSRNVVAEYGKGALIKPHRFLPNETYFAGVIDNDYPRKFTGKLRYYNDENLNVIQEMTSSDIKLDVPEDYTYRDDGDTKYSTLYGLNGIVPY
ncbi:hypothetical protein D7X33_31075, partial [Butyricicoccus sp. 1XD8-22]